MIRASAMLLLLALSACGSAPDDGVGGVSASEADALNDAAARIDAREGAGNYYPTNDSDAPITNDTAS